MIGSPRKREIHLEEVTIHGSPDRPGAARGRRAGATIGAVCAAHNISESAFYRWRKRYGDLQVSEVRHLRELESENARLKRLLTERDLEIDAIREVLRGR